VFDRVDGEETGKRGVVVNHQTRLGQVSLSRPRSDAQGHALLGPEGNREFLVAFHRGVECADLAERIAQVTAP